MDISATGAKVRLVASKTFPSGFDLTQFADDTDPFDTASMQIADKAMGLNGDLITWGKANPVPVALAVIPGSEDAKNLGALFEANRVGKGKTRAGDVVTVTVSYPDGRTKTFQKGAITDGPAAEGIASAGRLKTSTYQFVFENVAAA